MNNVMTAKDPSGVVFVVPCKPFSRKKNLLKNSPPNFNPRKRAKNVMSAKIPAGIIFVVLSIPISLKKLETNFFTPNFDTPFLGVVFTLRQKNGGHPDCVY